MKEISKVSEIEAADVAEYIRLDEPTAADFDLLKTYLTVAKNFIVSYTGRKAEELDDYPDFVIVVLILCQDMFDTRTLYVDKTNLNKVVECVLGMHAVNYL